MNSGMLYCPHCGFHLEIGMCGRPLCPDCSDQKHLNLMTGDMDQLIEFQNKLEKVGGRKWVKKD
jgi:hypothetical protein